MFDLIVDDHIRLRTFHPDDSEELFQVLEQERERLRPWIDPSALPETYKATRKFAIECYLYEMDDPLRAINDPFFAEIGHSFFPPLDPPLELAIWVDGKLCGSVTLGRLHDSNTAGEFGYWVAATCEGKGVISRSVRALTEYGIEQMRLERFVIGCAATNLRSRAVAERLGYRLHATVPNGEVVGKLIYDRVIYGIRATEWRERNRVGA